MSNRNIIKMHKKRTQVHIKYTRGTPNSKEKKGKKNYENKAYKESLKQLPSGKKY